MEKDINKHIESLKAKGLSKPAFKVPENYFEGFSDTLLEKISETSIPEHTGYKTPDNYFEQFSDEIISTIEEDSLPNTDGFETPTDYFNQLEDTIIASVKESTPSKKQSKVRILYTISSVAAALVLYLGISNYNQETVITFDTISSTDISAYIEQGNMGIDGYTLANVDDEIDLNGLFDDTISDIEMNDYLDSVDSEYLYLNN